MPIDSWKYLGFAVIAVVAIVGGLRVFRSKQRRIHDSLRSRQLVEFPSVWKESFQHLDKGDVESILNEIADILKIPVGLVRVSDRFDGELAAPDGYLVDSRMEALSAAYRRRWKSRNRSEPSKYPETVQAYVESLARPLS